VGNLLVSVVIPTYNSQKTLCSCLRSVLDQSFRNIEIIVVDSYSKDQTAKIARDNGARIVQTHWKLLGARYLGLLECKGDFVLMLDSDQILEKTAIERAAHIAGEGFDMLCFEENAFEANTWVKRLFESDRELINKAADIHLDPLQGVMLARFYKKQILSEAFKNIPKELLPTVVAHDHAIIYYEAYELSHRVGIVSYAVWHEEPASLSELWIKNFRYGKSTFEIARTKSYQVLLNKKVRLRKGASRYWSLGIQSYLLSFLKGVPYYLGYFSALIAAE
jgi:glycosyltransferase involved in cell wall biosynthesis